MGAKTNAPARTGAASGGRLASKDSRPPLERVLGRLDTIRRTGSRSWKARCPAHEDSRPSLSIREGDDGRVLVYCFAGCGGADVIASLGLDWADLFPDDLRTTSSSSGRSRRRGGAPPIPARDALEILDREALVVGIIAERLAKGEDAAGHRDDLLRAAGRIAEIRRFWMAAP